MKTTALSSASFLSCFLYDESIRLSQTQKGFMAMQ